jgi:hypothetical protein
MWRSERQCTWRAPTTSRPVLRAHRAEGGATRGRAHAGARLRWRQEGARPSSATAIGTCAALQRHQICRAETGSSPLAGQRHVGARAVGGEECGARQPRSHEGGRARSASGHRLKGARRPARCRGRMHRHVSRRLG